MSATRIERDSMGEVEVPEEALWGASTARAVANFPIAGRGLPAALVHGLGSIKAAAARANRELGVLDAERADWIERAALEVARGEHDAQFVVDVFQTGSGTSTNMNANEVIARRAAQLRGRAGPPIHPNDHVNRCQSSNDVMPTALHVAARVRSHAALLPALARVTDVLRERADAVGDVVKLGRTHLMDATPVLLGQELRGWARQVERAGERVRDAAEGLAEVPLGGTAVGTGIGSVPGFAERALEALSRSVGHGFVPARDRFEAQGARDAAVHLSAAVRGAAVALSKVANDVRLLASGPRGGLGELRLPALQPGSSIMPGKVNPVLCESVVQVAAQVVGNDAAVTLGGLGGQLELNACVPLIADNLLRSIELLARVSELFAERCLAGLEPVRERAEGFVEGSLALATPLAARIGYDAAAEIAKEAFASGRTVAEVARERSGLPEAELRTLLDPRAMVGR